MIQIKHEDKYGVYQVRLDNTVFTQAGLSNLSFLILNDNNYIASPRNKIYLAYDNFSAANKLYLMNELSKEVTAICKKIEEMTKMNIQIYQDIKEVVSQ